MQELPNWFKNDGQKNFEDILLPEFESRSVRALQIGAYSGDASLWLTENLNVTLTDVDTWEGSDEPVHHAMDWKSVEQIYDEKMEFSRSRGLVKKFKGTSDEFFKQNTETFDFIYVDGDHTAYGVLKDAVNAFESLEVGGILAFDDYQWSAGLGLIKEPRLAIDSFSSIYADRVELIVDGYQRWFRRTR